MKNTLLTVSTMVLVTCISVAQTLIPKVGITHSIVAIDNDEANMKLKIGITGGVGFNIPVNELLSIQPELSFVQKGFKGESKYIDNTTTRVLTQNVTINYLELPVLARVTFGTGTRFFLNAGPSIGYGLGGSDKSREVTVTLDQNNGTIRQTFETDGKIKFGKTPDDYEGYDSYIDNRIEISGQLGGGMIIANKIMIEVRYVLSFTNLLDELDGEDYRSKNKVLQLTVGVPISLK